MVRDSPEAEDDFTILDLGSGEEEGRDFTRGEGGSGSTLSLVGQGRQGIDAGPDRFMSCIPWI